MDSRVRLNATDLSTAVDSSSTIEQYILTGQYPESIGVLELEVEGGLICLGSMSTRLAAYKLRRTPAQ